MPSKRLTDVAGTGGRLDTLRALRDVLARSAERCEGTRDVAPLARELRDTLAQIDTLSTDRLEASPLDELARRRAAAWGADTDGGKSAGGAGAV